MQVRFLKPEEESVLEKFVAKHRHGGIEQTWVWGELQTGVPGRIAFYALGLFDKEKLVGSMLLVRQQMRKGKTWLWCPRGPLLPKGKEKAAWKIFQEKCKEIAKKEKDIYMRVESGIPADEDLVVAGKATKDQYLPEHTLVVDLTESEDGILKQMTQKGRYNIKQAEKKGVYVLRSDLTDFGDFYKILEDTAERDGFHLHGAMFYERMLELLEDRVQMYVAYKDHSLVAGMIVTHFGDTGTYYFGASANQHRRLMAPYALQWFAMQEAKKAGLKSYDFLGIAPPGEEKHVLAGVTQFKTRFGGDRVKYQKPQVFVYRPGWYKAVQAAKMLKG